MAVTGDGGGGGSSSPDGLESLWTLDEWGNPDKGPILHRPPRAGGCAPAILVTTGFVWGAVLGAWGAYVAWGDRAEAPEVIQPEVEVETEALLDAATIEMRGYDEAGNPGTFLYECVHDGERLVCTQQAGASSTSTPEG